MMVNECTLLESATGREKPRPLPSLLILTTLRGLFISKLNIKKGEAE